MKKYIQTSLEIHLFFGRIMKEHALFLQAAFPAGEKAYMNKADWYRAEFEKILSRTVQLADGIAGKDVLCSGEVFTEFTVMAEQQTERLTKIPIDSRITRAEGKLRAGCGECMDERMAWQIRQLNQQVLHLLRGLIAFKRKILEEVTSCRLYTANYPLLIEHIIREAKLYQQMITALEKRKCISQENIFETEKFWNQIMMEHALFIRGLLDPTECELVETADTFAGDYCRLLEEARKQDCRATMGLTRKTLETTKKYRDFKESGTKGITGCEIRSVILPLPAEQTHSPEWKIYVEETLPRYKGSKDFVSKLVAEKIREFAEHFSYLFVPEAEAPIRINLINTGDCREIVQGIVKYYVKALNDSRKIIPVKVTMYAGSKIESAFETMSKIDDTDTLVKALGLEIRAEDKSADEIIDLYRQKVQFYSKKADDELEYAHITFMELDDDDQAISTNMEDIPSGVVMNGISSGVPSAMLGDSYRTGFGTGYIRTDSELLDIAVKMNALNAAMNGDSYRKGSCYALKMSPNKQHLLNKVYDASNWVTFINPRVDLNYFKSDPGAKDLLIIHYSDQYNMTSSGYDAINVTRKSEQYQNTISRYLKKNGVEDENAHSKQIINIFNALNGDWLLRMLSYNSHFPVEKLSILSAMKLAVKSYTRDNIIWVPISLEEILRVSGSVGLSKNESVFSAKNPGFEEGSTSDDLLLAGIKNTEAVQVMFYPIEVKIGSVEGGYLEKGVWQALKTRGIFEEILEMGPCRGKSIKVRLYRNFFMQQVVVNAGKMLLYDVGDRHQGWENVTETDLRRKLLNEEYEIVEMLFPEMGKAGIISFRDGYTGEKEQRYQDVLIIEKSKKEGVNLLAKSFDEIKPIKWSEVPQVSSLPEEAETETDTGAETVETEELPTETGYGDQRISPGQEPDTGFVQEERKMEEIRALIGKDRFLNEVYWEFGNKALANRHLLITGTSGQGKTYSIQTILYELAKYNISSVIFDYTEGFMLQQLEKAFKDALGSRISQKIVYSTGVPVNPFKRHEVDLAGQKILEKESDVAARLADIFVHVYDFGDQQYSAIFDAAYNGLKKYGEKMNMDIFRNELEAVALQNKSAKTVLSKMSPFFHTVEFEKDPAFDWGEVLYADEAKINIVQLTLFTREMQVIITEMMLWDAWYYTKKYGSKDKPFVVVLDEAQNLSHTTKSPSASILTEGRKFGWSAWFATQSLKILKDDEVVRLLQAAFKLYFKPTDEEMAKIAKQLDVTGDTNWLAALKSLKKGQCIAAGDRMKSNGKVGPSAPVITDITSFEERL